MNGPYETARDAFEDARALRETVAAADPGGDMTQAVIAARAKARVQYLRGVLEVCGVEVGAYDRRIAEWVASWDLETIQVITGWVERARAAGQDAGPAEALRARYSWVLYKPQTGHSGILEASGIEGTAVGLVDPSQLAADMLARHSFGADAGDAVVKVFGADDRLVAWSQWEGGAAVAHLPQDGGKR